MPTIQINASVGDPVHICVDVATFASGGTGPIFNIPSKLYFISLTVIVSDAKDQQCAFHRVH